jgi:hypothetical protein
MIVMNYLANSLPLNNKTTGQLSDTYPNLFVPAGVTFSIWGIIYALLAGYCIVQFTALNHTVPLAVGWLFAVSCILNALWIVCWHYEKLPLSLLVMLGMLVVLTWINILISHIPFNILKASFGVYLGWICIATIANVTALLVHYDWKGFGLQEEVWAIIMISSGAIIAIVTLSKLNNPFIGLSVIWAFAGIILKRHADYRSIVIISVIAIIVVGFITISVFLRKSLPGMG